MKCFSLENCLDPSDKLMVKTHIGRLNKTKGVIQYRVSSFFKVLKIINYLKLLIILLQCTDFD